MFLNLDQLGFVFLCEGDSIVNISKPIISHVNQLINDSSEMFFDVPGYYESGIELGLLNSCRASACLRFSLGVDVSQDTNYYLTIQIQNLSRERLQNRVRNQNIPLIFYSPKLMRRRVSRGLRHWFLLSGDKVQKRTRPGGDLRRGLRGLLRLRPDSECLAFHGATRGSIKRTRSWRIRTGVNSSTTVGAGR
jgi:hypothetical protein